MSFDPSSILTDDEKQALVDQRAKQFAVDAFGHQLNREALLAAPQTEERDAEIAKIDAQLAVLAPAVESMVAKKAEIESAKAEAEVKGK